MISALISLGKTLTWAFSSDLAKKRRRTSTQKIIPSYYN